MNKSKHVSKIDMRHLDGEGGCPFIGVSSVGCIWMKDRAGIQYVCECRANEPAIQSVVIKNE